MKFKDAKSWATLSDCPQIPLLFTDEEVIALVGSLLYNGNFERLALHYRADETDPEIFENFELWCDFIEDVADVDLCDLNCIRLENKNGSCVAFYRELNPGDDWIIVAE